jgi:predicted dehydrogenase
MPSAGEPVRIIQVGAGAMGRAWLKVIGESDQSELVGLVDLDTDTACGAADACGFTGVPVAGSLEELFGRVDAQAVVNVTVPSAHASVSKTALLHGLPVLCEKPLAETVSQGLSMIAAAELSGQLLMVSQSRRYWRNLSVFRQQIAQLGPIGSVDCTFFRAPHFGGFREVMPFPLLMDMAIHQFDLARDLIGREPVAVVCNSYNPPWSWFSGDAAAQVLFEFDDGAHFSFSGSWCSPGLETSWNGEWRVSGQHGSATWDGDNEPTAEDADGQPITATVGDGPEQIAGSLAEFLEVTGTGTVPSGEAHSNVLSLAMVEAAIKSAGENRRVLVAEVLDQAYAEALRTESDPDLKAVLASWSSVRDTVG